MREREGGRGGGKQGGREGRREIKCTLFFQDTASVASWVSTETVSSEDSLPRNAAQSTQVELYIPRHDRVDCMYSVCQMCRHMYMYNVGGCMYMYMYMYMYM